MKPKSPRSMFDVVFKIVVVLVVVLVVASSLIAAVGDGWLALSAAGTTSANVVFPASPQRLVRISYVDATSDLSSSVLQAYSGTTVYTCSFANTNSGTNFTVPSTVGLAVGNSVVFQAFGSQTAYYGTIAATNSTNVGIAGFTNTFALGDQLWLMGSPITAGIGAATVRLSSSTLYFAESGRPLALVLNGTSHCGISNAVCHYEYPNQ